MTDTLDDHYVEWLYNLVGRRAKNINHWDLLHAMNTYDFVMIVPNDDNRCKDGKEIRNEFIVETRARPTAFWRNSDCSVLEMLIGVSRHLAFEMDGEVGGWFWHLVDNLGLSLYKDERFNARAVDQLLERLVWRQYNYDGSGGIFPLKNPHEDQREVEVWFQMEAYILEDMR